METLNTTSTENTIENTIEGEAVGPDFDPFAEDVPVAAVGLPPAFAVTDEKSASWVVRKIVEARLRAARVQEQLEAELRECRREEKWFLERFGPQLQQFAAQKLEGAKRKSLRLADGTLGFRTTPARLDVEDEKQLLEWARVNFRHAINFQVITDLSGITEEQIDLLWKTYRSMDKPFDLSEYVSKVELNRHLKDTGEIPPGCEIAGGEEKFYVK